MDSRQKIRVQNRRSLENQLNHNFQLCMDQLQDFWTEFGISKEQIMDRSNTVLMHIQNLLNDLIKEEEELMINIKNRIKNYEQELEKLQQELGEESESFSHLPLLQRDKYLFSQVESLKNKKAHRIQSYEQLQKNESRLLDELGMPLISKPLSDVPKIKELEELETHVLKLTDVREKRYHKYFRTKQQLTTILEETHIAAVEVPFADEIVSHNNENLILSQEKLDQIDEVLDKVQKLRNGMIEEMQILSKKLNILWDFVGVDPMVKKEFHEQHSEIRRSTILAMKQEIKRCEDLRLLSIIQRVTQLREDMIFLWDKCYIVDSERHQFDPFYIEEYTEELLQLHEAEVARLTKYYKAAEIIFDKIDQRHKLWNKMLEFERKAQNPTRFMNRGGKLLQEEKERNKLLKDLPRLEEEILQDIEMYESTNASPFFVHGVNFADYIKQQWENHQKEKENERLVRQKERTKCLTPSKRPVISTPVSAPSKLVRTNNALSTHLLNKGGVTPKMPGNKSLLAKKCKTSIKKAAVRSIKTRSSNLNLLMQKNFNRGVKSVADNSELYAQFAEELDQTGRERLRSSTVSSKCKVLGSKINRKGSLKKSRLVNNSGAKSKSKTLTQSSKSQNLTKTPTKTALPRGKLGLPFLI